MQRAVALSFDHDSKILDYGERSTSIDENLELCCFIWYGCNSPVGGTFKMMPTKNNNGIYLYRSFLVTAFENSRFYFNTASIGWAPSSVFVTVIHVVQLLATLFDTSGPISETAEQIFSKFAQRASIVVVPSAS